MMHPFMESIGFSSAMKERELEQLLLEVCQKADRHDAVSLSGSAMVAFQKEFAPNMGICVCGIMDEDGFHKSYYYPYYKSSAISTFLKNPDIGLRTAGDSYSCIGDDARLGFSLIFYLQNPIDYKKREEIPVYSSRDLPVHLTGLASEGTILLPCSPCNYVREEQRIKDMIRKNDIADAARNGDEEAMEQLTIEDMNTYTMVAKRLEKEDIFSIIDTSFMPCGMECDQYQIIGNIRHYNKVQNVRTRQAVYQLELECNDVNLEICIREKDLLGDPDVGRRFRGKIWLQGHVDFL